jgi:hypothetical protein
MKFSVARNHLHHHVTPTKLDYPPGAGELIRTFNIMLSELLLSGMTTPPGPKQ